MGSASQHGFFGFAIVTSVLIFFNFERLVLLFHVILFLFGNIFPDVDHYQSKIHRWLGWPRLYKKWKHWGRSHTIIGCFLFSIPIITIELITAQFGLPFSCVFLSFNAGCLCHCILDDLLKSKNNKRRATKAWT